jgi:hypothetical protein
MLTLAAPGKNFAGLAAIPMAILRECSDHMIIFNEAALYHFLVRNKPTGAPKVTSFHQDGRARVRRSARKPFVKISIVSSWTAMWGHAFETFFECSRAAETPYAQ